MSAPARAQSHPTVADVRGSAARPRVRFEHHASPPPGRRRLGVLGPAGRRRGRPPRGLSRPGRALSPWKAIRGPFSACVATAKRLGISIDGLRWFHPVDGYLSLAEQCPRAIATALARVVDA
eukprot:4492432-Pyramimonas_sp.AAC.1